MPFFSPTPNLSDDEKARIEFHLQQVAEQIGFERFTLPVLSQDSVLYQSGALRTPDQIMARVGQHLGHDISGVSIQSDPLQPEKCGGGG